jgi:hypothetical protein
VVSNQTINFYTDRKGTYHNRRTCNDLAYEFACATINLCWIWTHDYKHDIENSRPLPAENELPDGCATDFETETLDHILCTCALTCLVFATNTVKYRSENLSLVNFYSKFENLSSRVKFLNKLFGLPTVARPIFYKKSRGFFYQIVT